MRDRISLKLILLITVLFICGSLINTASYADQQTSSSKDKLIHADFLGSDIISHSRFIGVGHLGKIYISGDTGKKWKEVNSSTTLSLYSVSFPNQQDGWICGKSGTILHSSDSGNTWIRQDSHTSNHLFSIHFADSKNGLAVGDWGRIVITNNGGKSWQNVSLEEDIILYAAVMLDTTQCCVIGESGRIFITNNAGKSWIEVDSPVFTSLFCLTVNGNTLFAGGIDGTVIYSIDQGRSWQNSTTDSNKALYDIAVKDLNPENSAGAIGWAAGELGAIMLSEDGGKNWRTMVVPERAGTLYFGTVSLQPLKDGNIMGFVGGAKGLSAKIKNNTLIW